MHASEVQILHSTAVVLSRDAAALITAFETALGARAASLQTVIGRLPFEGGRSFVQVLAAAIVPHEKAGEPEPNFIALSRCRRAYRWEPRYDALIGQAFIAALAQILGQAFDEDARIAWTDGYVRLAEALLAATCNRMDLVA